MYLIKEVWSRIDEANSKDKTLGDHHENLVWNFYDPRKGENVDDFEDDKTAERTADRDMTEFDDEDPEDDCIEGHPVIHD